MEEIGGVLIMVETVDTARNAIIFVVDNSSSSYVDNLKNNI